VQVYAGLDIGSAKTPRQDRAGVPHHLLDLIEPDGEVTAGDYVREATAVLEAIRLRGVFPVIVGGTGFYLRALLHGLSPAPTRNPELRERLVELVQRRPAALHRFLQRQDRAAAARIHPNDHQKLIRAIELAGQTTEPRQGLAGFRVLKIGLNPERGALYDRLNERSRWMFENGLLEETEGLLKRGVPASAKPLATLGYRQAVRVLTHDLPLEEAIADCQLRTRHYAKRQITWFRAEPDVYWLTGFGEQDDVKRQAGELVQAFLSG